MKSIATVLLLTAALAQAQVYVPGPQYPLCFPQVVIVGGQTTTVIVCQ
jgi:aspartate/methionine/tyrosine aminotransferase